MILDKAPYKYWIDQVENEMLQVIKKAKLKLCLNDLKEFCTHDFSYINKLFKSKIKQCSEACDDNSALALSELYNKVSIYYTLINAYEFRVFEPFDMFNIDLDVKDIPFSLPFPEVLVTFYIPNIGYKPIFVSIVELEEKFRYKDKDCRAYKLKVGMYEIGKGSMTAYEMFYIEEFSPRILIACNNLHICEHCNPIDMSKKLTLNGVFACDYNAIVYRDEACLKGRSTLHSCLYGVSETKTVAEECDELIKFTLYLIKSFSRNTIKRETSISSKTRARGNVSKPKVDDREHIIDLNKPLFRYQVVKKSSYLNRVKHSSPREHIRKAHDRHLKSGKVVKVKQAVVNRGKAKVVYSLRF